VAFKEPILIKHN